MIANALDRMATAAERSGENPLTGTARNTGIVPAESAGSAESEKSRELREKDEEIQRMREEMNERIRALREENERLRAGEGPEEENLELYEEDNDFASDLYGDDLEDEEDYGEYETEMLNPFGDADDDAYPEEDEGEIAMLFGAPDDYNEDLDDEDNFSDYEDEDEAYDAAEDYWREHHRK